MIKEIKQLIKKYKEISRNYDSVTVHQILSDLYRLESEARIKRIPKNER